MADASNPESEFAKQFKDALGKASRGAILWSMAYHGSGIGSILASAGAAFFAATTLSEVPGTDPAPIAALSGIAGVLTAISAFTGCSRKWRVNRTTRMKLRLLKLVILKEGETDKVRDRYADIMREHERGILGPEAE